MNTITRAKVCSANGYFFLDDPKGSGVELTFKDSPSVRIWDDGLIELLDEVKTGYVVCLDDAVATANRYLGF